MADSHPYRFGQSFFLKSPWSFLDSTRSPYAFKNNSNQVLFLARSPLNFLEIVPAIQAR